MKKIVLATNNLHKVREIKQILDIKEIEIIDLNSFPDLKPALEDGLTFKENALKKARHIFNNTKIFSLADDSGLSVDYLLGAPGVYSARYAGENHSYEDNNRRLLNELKGVPPRKRTARFKCCIALIGEGFENTVDGAVEGKILFSTRGKNGFGYDPLFLPVGYDKTFAELDSSIKNQISHRAKALNNVKEILKNLL
jgi:XTP/dITP diphosphohydrolase